MSRCPAMPVTSDSVCNNVNQCGADKPCQPGYQCCSSACGTGWECKPDLGVCSDADKMISFSEQSQAQPCLAHFTKIATMTQSADQFCSSFFDGIECLAGALAQGAQGAQGRDRIKEDCKRRMIYHVFQHGAEALRKIMEQVAKSGTVVGVVNHDPAECPVVKQHLTDTTELDEDRGRPAQPDFDRTSAAECGDITKVFEKAEECRPILNQGQGNTGLKEKCEFLKRFFHCVVEKLGGQRDENRCLGDIKQLLERAKDRLAAFPALAHIQDCHDMDHVCGEGMMPHPVKRCGGNDKEGCPGGFECRKDFCCPKEREGMCPALKGPPNCAKLCDIDDDCEEDEKCCGDTKVCGNKTCVPREATDQSKCHQEFEKAVEKLGQMGVCGDGKTQIEIPRCQGEKYAPVQGDFRNNQLYCAKEDGTKVKGADFQGNKNCVKEREGTCNVPAACRGNAVLLGSCKNDGDCPTKEHKCCVGLLDGSCLKHCVLPEAVPDNDVVPIPACPNNEERSCCPVIFNVGKRCPAHPGAIPRINPCGGCKTEWLDKDGNKVDCHEGLSKCRREQAEAMEKNMRMRPEREQLALFIKGLKEKHRAPEEKEKDEYDGDARDMKDLEMDEEDYGEYEDWTEEEHKRYMSWISEKICHLMDSQKVCQHGGLCALNMTSRRPHQICSCPPGFGGLFCEKASKPGNSFTCLFP